jgi:hypothetical protein
MDRFRLMLEDCESVQGVLVGGGLGGAAGAGLVSMVLDRLATDYPGLTKMFDGLYPSTHAKECSPLSSYNFYLAHQSLIENAELCRVGEMTGCPSAEPERAAEAMAFPQSRYALALGLPGPLPASLPKLHQNMVAFPRVHFLTA